jgi:hypothetical protein
LRSAEIVLSRLRTFSRPAKVGYSLEENMYCLTRSYTHIFFQMVLINMRNTICLTRAHAFVGRFQYLQPL